MIKAAVSQKDGRKNRIGSFGKKRVQCGFLLCRTAEGPSGQASVCDAGFLQRLQGPLIG